MAKKQIVDLPGTLEEAHKTITAQKAVIEELNVENAKVTGKLKATEKAGESLGLFPSFEHEGKSYRSTVPHFSVTVNSEQKTVTAEELSKDVELQSQLIKMRSGNIEEVK